MNPPVNAKSTVISTIREGWRAVVDAVFPNDCAACGHWTPCEAGLLCDTCRAEMVDLARLPYCHRCARTVSPLSQYHDGCTVCRTERHWNVRAIARVGDYDGPLRDLVLAMKYGGSHRATLALAELLAARLTEMPWIREIDALVPVPMHSLRRLQRPVDHAYELAAATSEAFSRRTVCETRLTIPVRRAVVRRVRYEQSQARATSMTKRIEQIRDAFAPGKRQNPNGWRVCIIDNVITSGATLHEVSSVLRKAGTKTIYAAVIGRASLIGDGAPDLDAIRATMSMLRGVSSLR